MDRNKVRRRSFTFAALTLLCGAFFLTGCGKYNYGHIFPFPAEIHRRAVRLDKAEGFECEISEREFEAVKMSLRRIFAEWKPLHERDVFYSENVCLDGGFYGKTSSGAFFTWNRNSRLWREDGVFPVVIYFPKAKKLLFFIADGCGG